MDEFVDLSKVKITLPDRIVDELARSLARFLPELYAKSPTLRAEYQAWLKTPEGEKYAEPAVEASAP